MTHTNNNPKRIYIAGGYGLVGSNIARHIRRIDKQVEITLAGRNPEKGAALADELENSGTAHLDTNGSIDPKDLAGYDLIIQSLQDRSGRLFEIALDTEIAHIDITKLAHEITPSTFAALGRKLKRPVVQTSHWMAGVLTIVAQKAAKQFKRIDSVEAAGLYDPRDPIGPMVENEMDGYTKLALLRKDGRWLWVDSKTTSREFELSGGTAVTGYPMAVLDVPSLASITGAPDLRFDFAEGESTGSRKGKKASHDFYIDFEGILKSGEPARRRTFVSDPNGQAHLTALGALVSAERVLGLDGKSAAEDGIYLPDTLVDPVAAVERFQEFGVEIRQLDL